MNTPSCYDSGSAARRRRYALLRAVASVVMLLSVLLGAGISRAEGEQPYRINELQVHVGPGAQTLPAVGGSWVVWRESLPDTQRLVGRNLAGGQDFTLADISSYDIEGNRNILAVSSSAGIFTYQLGELSRQLIAMPAGDRKLYRAGVKISSNIVVWAEGSNPDSAMDIYAHDLATGQTMPICTHPAQQERPAVSGNIVVWADARNRDGSGLVVFDLYGYDLAAKREFRITRQPEPISALAISGNTVVWCAQRDRAYHVLTYDITSGQDSVLANMGYDPGPSGIDIDGDLVAWSAQPKPFADYDILGYDLAQKWPFTISRAIGDQRDPQISGRTVIWTDTRNQSLNKYDYNPDIYGATLTPGTAPMPPVIGAPQAVDTKIQIVWPHGGTVAQADKANIGTYLFQPDTLKPVPCQWHPQVYLWRALNNSPARIVATGSRCADCNSGILWQHNDVDVSAARDPQNRLYFFVTVEGTPTQYNVWAHATDARTYFPHQDVPLGVAPATSAVDARIQIVWPQGGLPVDQAEKANLTALLFVADSKVSVPAEWNPTVRLWSSLNNGVSKPVAIGHKGLVRSGELCYPIWDFNDIDVSAARDPANKYYFTLSVDGVQTYSNVWVHGVDARTYFPQQDTPDGTCW